MKLDRGYTYPQFIDLIKSKGSNIGDLLIYSFNKFCQQILTEEMLINKVRYPSTEDNERYNEYVSDLKAWQEADKKVILKGDVRVRIFADGRVRIDVDDKVAAVLPNGFGKYTVGDLFRKTGGELELKNVEI